MIIENNQTTAYMKLHDDGVWYTYLRSEGKLLSVLPTEPVSIPVDRKSLLHIPTLISGSSMVIKKTMTEPLGEL